MSLNVFHIVGARPNFMKAAPVILALQKHPAVRQRIIHTGQHYDANMSDIFFRQLGLPRPDINLEAGSGSHAVQTAQIMIRFEETVMRERPDLVLVYGDVNSTAAATLVCAKLGIRVGHVEAGLRSFDRTMPEEINRLVTDQLADILFTPSPDGDANLEREGVAKEKIRRVGNCMIDTLVRLLPEAKRPELAGVDGKFALVTLHRPSNVDDPDNLRALWAALTDIGQKLDVVFPVHPRTRTRLESLGLITGAPTNRRTAGAGPEADVPPDTCRVTPATPPSSVLRPPSSVPRLPTPQRTGLHLLEPLGYLEFLALERDAAVVITDSGGVQEETTYLKVPCLTMRENTERPITCTEGTNILIGRDLDRLKVEVNRVLEGSARPGRIPALWDGKAGERVAEIVAACCKVRF